MDLFTILAALLPVAVEGGKYAVQKWLAPETVKPGTFAEFLQLQANDLERFKVMQGTGQPSYLWVAAVREMQRPVVVAGVLGVWVYQAATGEVSQTVANMAGAIGFYLFGDRTMFHIAGRAK